MIEAEPETDTLDAAEGFARTRAKATGYLAVVKRYRSVRNGPFRCGADLAASLSAIVIGQLEGYPQSPTQSDELEYWQKSFDAGYVADLLRAQEPNFIVAARDHLGTHTAKIPNPRVSGPGGLVRDASVYAAAASTPFASGATTAARQVVGAAGNAALGKAQRFLSTRLMIEGRPVDVCDDIAVKGPVYDALLSLGFGKKSLDDVSAILTRRLAGQDEAPIGSLAKMLLWPTAGGDVTITPVHPYAMHIEIAERIKEREAAHHDVPRNKIKVGGSKPQNSGLVNGDLGGWHTCLKSLPPAVGSRRSRLLVSLVKSGAMPLAKVGKSHPSISAFLRVVASKAANDAARSRLDREISALIRAAIRPIVEVRAMIAAGEASRADVRSLGGHLPVLLVRGFPALEAGAQRDLVEEVTVAIAAMPHGVVFDDAMRRRVRENVVQAMERAFP